MAAVSASPPRPRPPASGRQYPRRATATKLPDFLAPPVVEVALSLGFEQIEGIGVVNLVQLWESRFRDRFPKVEEQSPIDMAIEPLGKASQGGAVSVQLMQRVPLPRLWFLDADGAHLVQVQNNWLARNWRKVGGTVKYPRYPDLRRSFRRHLSDYRAYLKEAGLGDINPVQCEVTYINHVELPDTGQSRGLAGVLSLVDDRPIAFDAAPESVRIAAQYVITHNGQSVGRLHVSAEPAVRRSDGRDLAVLTITARGIPLGRGDAGILGFFDLGREWALRAFTGITREAMHRHWRKT